MNACPGSGMRHKLCSSMTLHYHCEPLNILIPPKSALVGLGTDVKLSLIELKDRILRDVPGTHNYFLALVACKIKTLKPDNLSLVPI